MTTRFPPNARHVQPGRRRLTFESLEQRCMLAHGDSYRDLVNIDMTPFSPHVPFVVVNENPDLEVNASGLTPITDAAILIHGNLRSLQPDNYRFAARKGDIVAIFSSLFQTNLNINGTYPSGSFASSQTFFTKYFFTAPATKEYEFSVGGQFGAVGNYKLGLAIIPNIKPVAQFTFTSSTATDTSYDPEEQVIGSTGITQRQWSTGGTGVTTSLPFTAPGTYPVTLTVTDNDGETASVTHDIVVVAPPTTGRLSSLQYVGGAVSILPDPGTSNPLFDSNPNRKDYEADTNQDGTPEQQQPVLYAAGAVPAVDATFTMSAGASGQYSVKGIRGTGEDQFVFEGVANVANGLLTVQGMQAKVAPGGAPKTVGDQVKKYEDFEITWTITKSGSQPISAGTSHNALYVSAAAPYVYQPNISALTGPDKDYAPSQASPFLSLVDVAVSRNQGLTAAATDQKAIIEGTFSYFVGNEATTSNDYLLTYWRGGSANTADTQTPAGLLGSGDGKCGAWSRLFLSFLAINGVLPTNGGPELIGIESPYLADGEHLMIQSVTFNGTGSTGNTLPYFVAGTTLSNVLKQQIILAPFDVVSFDSEGGHDSDGLSAQNNSEPPEEFNNHALLRLGAEIFDPSYGTKFDSISDWEDASLAGFIQDRTERPIKISESVANIDFNGENGKTDVYWAYGFIARRHIKGVLDDLHITPSAPRFVTAVLSNQVASASATFDEVASSPTSDFYPFSNEATNLGNTTLATVSGIMEQSAISKLDFKQLGATLSNLRLSPNTLRPDRNRASITTGHSLGEGRMLLTDAVEFGAKLAELGDKSSRRPTIFEPPFAKRWGTDEDQLQDATDEVFAQFSASVKSTLRRKL